MQTWQRRLLLLSQTRQYVPRVASSASSFLNPNDKRIGRIEPKPRPAPTSVSPQVDTSSLVHQPTFPVPNSTPAPISSSRNALTRMSPAAVLLNQPCWIVGRQIEMLNVLIGYEQANKYSIKDAHGQDIGFIAEEEQTFKGMILRQLLRTRRPFKAVVLDAHGQVVLKVERPIKWLLNSKISIKNHEDKEIGQVVQVWHLWRRRYELFVNKQQFAFIDGGFWTWDFMLQNEQHALLSSINRNFVGFAREIFTDSGQYVVRMEALPEAVRRLTYDERAVVMAAAITIDIDYFSRHSGNGGFLPIPMIGSGSQVPATTSSPVGGVVGMPFPIIIPGMGGWGGSSTDAPAPSTGAPPVDVSPPMDAPYSPPSSNWGDAGFVPDEQSQQDSGFIPDEPQGSWTDTLSDLFGGDD